MSIWGPFSSSPRHKSTSGVLCARTCVCIGSCGEFSSGDSRLNGGRCAAGGLLDARDAGLPPSARVILQARVQPARLVFPAVPTGGSFLTLAFSHPDLVHQHPRFPSAAAALVSAACFWPGLLSRGVRCSPRSGCIVPGHLTRLLGPGASPLEQEFGIAVSPSPLGARGPRSRSHTLCHRRLPAACPTVPGKRPTSLCL